MLYFFPKKFTQAPYLISLLFYEIGRTLPHAILPILIISLNGNGSSILLLQIIWYLAISLFEIPSGILSDVILNKRNVYIISIVSIIIGFSIMSFAGMIWIFAIGQFFYGMSQALSSGTAEILILDSLKDEPAKRRFINWSRAMTYLGAFIGGGSGSFIYLYFGQKWLYLIAVMAFICSLLCSFLTQKDSGLGKNFNKSVLRYRLKINIKKNIDYFKNPHYLILLFSIIITAMAFGPFFNFWQIFYKHNNIPSHYFGLVYVVLQAIGILSSYINNKLRPRKWLQLISAFLAGGIFILVISLTKTLVFAFLFPMFLFPLYYYSFTAENKFHLNLNNKTSSGQTSIFSTIKSFMNMLVYWNIYALVKITNEEIGSIISLSGFMLTALICIYLGGVFKKIKIQKM